MRKLFACLFSVFALLGSAWGGQELKVPEYVVKPLKYPKFSLFGAYNLGRRFHGFADQRLRFSLANQYGGALAFEAGLYQYFNAGAQLSFNFPNIKDEPLMLRLGLFAKPYFPLNQQWSIFARLGAGVSASERSMKRWLSASSPSVAAELDRVYASQEFFGTAFGGNTLATIGLEFFPWPLFGFALEGGFRAELWRERGPKSRGSSTPHNFDYLIYEFPLGLTVHIIL